MSFQKFKTNSYCVGQKHYSGTKNIVGEITLNKKTGRDIKLLVGQCSICNRKKSMIVSDNRIQAEGLGDFFKNLGKKRINCIKKDGKKRIKKPRKSSRNWCKRWYCICFSKPESSFDIIARSDKILP